MLLRSPLVTRSLRGGMRDLEATFTLPWVSSAISEACQQPSDSDEIRTL